MPKSHTWLPWAALFGTIATVEVLVRFAVPFSLRRVLVVEALLFFGAALAALRLTLRPAKPSKWRRLLQWSLVWGLALGAIRAAIWAAGQPVTRANLAALLVAIIALAASRIRRRRQSRQPPQAS